jgi:multidrug efflux pump subunit AcrA (membrane-fusion protein)
LIRWLLAAATLLLGCGQPASRAGSAQPVVRSGKLEDRFTLTGELAATRKEALRVPKTPSWMIAIKWMVEEGANVKKGDRLVEFDTSSLSGSLADKMHAAQRAQAELESDVAKNTSTEMEKRIEVERKRVALEKARVEASVPADLRTQREHQEKQLAVSREEDAFKRAEEDLAALQRAARLDRRVKEIALVRASRELEELKSRLDELTLRAPRDGLVQVAMNDRGPEQRKLQIGDTAYTGMPVVTMPDLSEMHVEARLHDVDEGAIRAGMSADCVLDAYPGRIVPGKVASISAVARLGGRDVVRRVFDVVVKLDRTDSEIMLPGMSVRVEVVRRRAEKTLLVPRQALRSAGGKTYARLRDGSETAVELEFCALHECALRRGPPEGTPVETVGEGAAAVRGPSS